MVEVSCRFSANCYLLVSYSFICLLMRIVRALSVSLCSSFISIRQHFCLYFSGDPIGIFLFSLLLRYCLVPKVWSSLFLALIRPGSIGLLSDLNNSMRQHALGVLYPRAAMTETGIHVASASQETTTLFSSNASFLSYVDHVATPVVYETASR